MIVSVDRERHRVVIRPTSFVDRASMEKGRLAIIAAARQARAGDHHFDCMIVLNENGPAAKEAAGDHEELLAELNDLGLRRSAQVGFSAIARLQLKRLTGNDTRYRYFDEESEAERWLNSPQMD